MPTKKDTFSSLVKKLESESQILTAVKQYPALILDILGSRIAYFSTTEKKEMVVRLLPYVNVNIDDNEGYLIHYLLREGFLEESLIVIKNPKHRIGNYWQKRNVLQYVLNGVYCNTLPNYIKWPRTHLIEFVEECFKKNAYFNEQDFALCAGIFTEEEEFLLKAVEHCTWSNYTYCNLIIDLVESLIPWRVMQSVLWQIKKEQRLVLIQHKDPFYGTAVSILNTAQCYRQRYIGRRSLYLSSELKTQRIIELATVLVEFGLDMTQLAFNIAYPVRQNLLKRLNLRICILFGICFEADWRVTDAILLLWPEKHKYQFFSFSRSSWPSYSVEPPNF
jgi:hypothetical protein